MSITHDKDTCLSLLTDMLRIRRLEEKSAKLYGAGNIRGFLHLYIGEEAVAVGALHALSAQDNIIATYREHGYALVRGVPMDAIMAEMFGKRDGCSHGRGGSMHLFDRERRFYGGNAIVGGGLPVAVALALADSMQGEHRISACFFGEGAVAAGAFHEAMNLAALWRLRCFFYAKTISMPWARRWRAPNRRPTCASRRPAITCPPAARASSHLPSRTSVMMTADDSK